MKKSEVEHFKKKLLQLKSEIMNQGLMRSNEDLHISSDDLADETDLATSVINQQVSFNIRARELNKIREIESALYRIDEGIYGECEECGDPIGKKRLENQPWATLCIIHAEEKEREGQRYARRAY